MILGLSCTFDKILVTNKAALLIHTFWAGVTTFCDKRKWTIVKEKKVSNLKRNTKPDFSFIYLLD